MLQSENLSLIQKLDKYIFHIFIYLVYIVTNDTQNTICLKTCIEKYMNNLK